MALSDVEAAHALEIVLSWPECTRHGVHVCGPELQGWVTTYCLECHEAAWGAREHLRREGINQIPESYGTPWWPIPEARTP